jgi:hypothetical protein
VRPWRFVTKTSHFNIVLVVVGIAVLLYIRYCLAAKQVCRG